jgi:glycosyltransferase involved in cell wall biosynthesis
MIDNSGKIISVITINLNDREGLLRTIESVKAQNSNLIEHIVIDGGSTDGSAEFIKENASLFSFWSSEKDKGVYDAQNKGISKAKGEYLIFLNSGDTFYSSDVAGSFIEFSKGKTAKIFYGNSNIIKADGTHEKLSPPNKLSLNFWYRGTLNHQAVFFRKDVFSSYGNYDTSYKFSSDMDLLLKVFKKEPQAFEYFDKLICNYQEVGISARPENYGMLIEEKERILKKQLTALEYNEAQRAYLKNQSFRTRFRIFISNRPFLKKILGK